LIRTDLLQWLKFWWWVFGATKSSIFLKGFLPFLAIETCGQHLVTTGNRIFDGEILKDRLYPWAGAFFYKEIFYCGGNLSKFLLKYFLGDGLILLSMLYLVF
jgi:hypothetical protein